MTVTKQRIAGVTWNESSGYYSAVVAGWLTMEFSYRDVGYWARVAGHGLPTMAPDTNQAAEMAVNAAVDMLAKAARALEHPSKPAPKHTHDCGRTGKSDMVANCRPDCPCWCHGDGKLASNACAGV